MFCNTSAGRRPFRHQQRLSTHRTTVIGTTAIVAKPSKLTRPKLSDASVVVCINEIEDLIHILRAYGEDLAKRTTWRRNRRRKSSDSKEVNRIRGDDP